MDAASLKNQTIVTVSGAEQLGTVSEILFETEPLRVAALKATDDNGDFVVPFERVKRFGPDAVMVESAEVRATARGVAPTMRTLEELTHLNVMDEDGRSLGMVRALEFDPDTGHVEEITAGTGGGMLSRGTHATIKARGIRGVGHDLITVASSGEDVRNNH